MCFVSAGGKIIGADKLGDLQGNASWLDVFKQVKSLFEDDQVERFLVQLVVGNSRSGCPDMLRTLLPAAMQNAIVSVRPD